MLGSSGSGGPSLCTISRTSRRPRRAGARPTTFASSCQSRRFEFESRRFEFERCRMSLAIAPSSELERLGCTLASSALDFFDAVKPRLSRVGKYDASLDALAETMVEHWGLVSVAQMQEVLTYEKWQEGLVKVGLPTAWVSTFARALDVDLSPAMTTGRLGGTPCPCIELMRATTSTLIPICSEKCGCRS